LADTARELATQLLADVAASGCRELLVLRPEDRFAFERVYRDRLGLPVPDGLVLRDVTEVLAEALDSGRLRFRPRVHVPPYVYHDPCHTARVNRDDAAPRRLLAAALGDAAARDTFWRGRRAHPCGAIGGLQFTHPAIADKLADARLSDARAAGAAWIISDDPSCVQQLRRRAAQADLTVLGFYEVLAEQLVSE
jgi:Fe-S oxidoreductase